MLRLSTLLLVIALSTGCLHKTTLHRRSATSPSWSLVSTGAAIQINHFAINGSNNHWYLAARESGFWRSTDQGATWVQINSGITGLSGWSIDVNPATGTLIAGTSVTGSQGKFYRSTNDGASWTVITLPFAFSTPAYSGCAFAPGNITCGGFWAPSPSTGLWTSTNDGVTTTVGMNPTGGDTTVFSTAYNSVDNSLWYGTEQRGVSRSTDGGLNWVAVSPPDQNIDPVNGIRDGNADSITFDRNNNPLFVAQGGIWKASGSGNSYTWTNVKGNPNTAEGKAIGIDTAKTLYYGHHLDTTDTVTIYCSTQDGAAGTWSDCGQGIPASLEAHQFLISPVDGSFYTVVEGKGNAGWVYKLNSGAGSPPPTSPTSITGATQ